MSYEVSLTKDAERDLEEIYLSIADRNTKVRADLVLDRLVKGAEALGTSPERGVHVDELRPLGVTEYRQVFLRPYRLIHRVHAEHVVVYVIADGRRDMGMLLSRRLLAT
jgi:toxin ParE1/3/4